MVKEVCLDVVGAGRGGVVGPSLFPMSSSELMFSIPPSSPMVDGGREGGRGGGRGGSSLSRGDVGNGGAFNSGGMGGTKVMELMLEELERREEEEHG